MSVLQNLDLSEEEDSGEGTFSAEQTDFLRSHIQ